MARAVVVSRGLLVAATGSRYATGIHDVRRMLTAVPWNRASELSEPASLRMLGKMQAISRCRLVCSTHEHAMPTRKRRAAQGVRSPEKTEAPHFVEPMAALSVGALPEGPEWSYELKLDGYRALIIKDGTSIRVRSRNDKDLMPMYPAVAAAGRRLQAEQAVIDGEIVAIDKQGRPSFQALQHRGTHPDHTIVFYAFDLLHLNGQSTTALPLKARRTKLARVIDKSGLLLSLELPGSAADIVSTVRAMQLEGVVAKREASMYEAGERSGSWQKLKLERQQEFVIGGYRPSGNSSVDALLVGYFEKKDLRFAAKVRAGLVPHVRSEFARKLKPLQVKHCPFVDLPTEGSSRWGGGVSAEDMKEMIWTKPEMVVQIQFVEWTAENRLRLSKFVGLRSDKAAVDVHREL